MESFLDPGGELQREPRGETETPESQLSFLLRLPPPRPAKWNNHKSETWLVTIPLPRKEHFLIIIVVILITFIISVFIITWRGTIIITINISYIINMFTWRGTMWRGLLRLELVVEFWEVSQDRESVRRLATCLVIIIVRSGAMLFFLQMIWFVSHRGHCHNCFHYYYRITINSNIITLLPYQQGPGAREYQAPPQQDGKWAHSSWK